MKDIIDQIKVWLSEDQSIALATVIRTWGSSPRSIGAGMAVSQDGRIAGSVSGGCVEGSVIQAAQEVIETKIPKRLHFGVVDAEAWEVGLACGGEIEVYIRPFSIKDLNSWVGAYNAKTNFCSILFFTEEPGIGGREIFLFEGNEEPVSVLSMKLKDEQIEEVRNLLASGASGLLKLKGAEDTDIFIHVISTPIQLVIVGGVHIAVPLVDLAEILGFEVIVIDPRRLFITEERFPDVTLIPEWPSSAFNKIELTSSSAIVMLTHDPKIDDPALITALGSPAFYVGALGSTRTHEERKKRLRTAGIDDSRLEKIHAPIGMDLGGNTPVEIALSIIAEITQLWNSI